MHVRIHVFTTNSHTPALLHSANTSTRVISIRPFNQFNSPSRSRDASRHGPDAAKRRKHTERPPLKILRHIQRRDRLQRRLQQRQRPKHHHRQRHMQQYAPELPGALQRKRGCRGDRPGSEGDGCQSEAPKVSLEDRESGDGGGGDEATDKQNVRVPGVGSGVDRDGGAREGAREGERERASGESDGREMTTSNNVAFGCQYQHL